MEAEPSAVAVPSNLSTLEGYNDLLDNVSGNYQYLNDSTGLIKVHDYATSTTATSTTAGDVQDYLRGEKVQRGETGTPVQVSSYTYIAHTADAATAGDGLGPTVYPMASQTDYHNADGTGGQTTRYAYTWMTSGGLATTAAQSKTTSKPVISTAQNGPGTADTMVEVYDAFGRVQWTQDGDGFLTYTGYDDPTGSPVKQIADVNTADTGDFTNLPSGWSTPSGGGLHLITTMAVDGLGRTTTTTDPKGNVTYTVYNDPNHEVRTYPGWQASTATTTGPIQVTREHRPAASPANDQPYNETLTTSATPATTAGVPNGTETISTSNVQTLSRSYLDKSNRVVRTDSYFSLSGMTYTPDGLSADVGTQNTNYYESTIGYDEMGRKAKAVNALGTITRKVYDNESRPSAMWVVTSDSGWADATGGGNMTLVSQNVYDGGGVGDSDLTRTTQYPDTTGSNNRVSVMSYDWRDRLVATKQGVQGTEATTVHRPIVLCDLDNLGRCTARSQFDGDGVTVSDTDGDGVPNKPSSSLLRAETLTGYDDQNRPYATTTLDINQSNGTDGLTGGAPASGLVSNTWYDHRGNVIKSAPPGAPVAKSAYDGAGRLAKRYTTDGGGDSAWADAGNVTGDAVLQQTQNTYDAAGNVVLTTTKQRFHDETATGELGTSTTSPKAWVSFASGYYDAANRQTASVQLGKVSGDTYTVPGTVPTSSATVLVTGMAYNTAGWVSVTTDPRGLYTGKSYDLMGRTVQQVEAYDGSTTLPLAASSVTNSANRATNYAYDGLGHTVQLTAVMPSGTNSQTTQYDYGVTASSGGSTVTSNDLLATVQYPGRTTGSPGTTAADEQQFAYNAVGQQVSMLDQNGTTHAYTYDPLGRRVSDAVTVASGNPQHVDTSVLCQTVSFDTGGRPYQLTSLNAASSGTVVNQVQMAYNGLGQLTAEYQNHSGAVSTSTTPSVQYAYVEMAGGANNSRLTGTTYPNGRVVYTVYNDAGDTAGVSATISRVTAICSASTRGTSDANVIAGYTYLGLSTVVRKDYPTPQTRLDLWGGTSGTYAGLDQFQRVTSQDWVNYATSGSPYDVFKLNHGYDQDSNRLYAANTAYPGASQVYAYDNLNRLTQFKAGLINSGNTDTQSFWTRSGQRWTYDTLGNQTKTDEWDNGSGGFANWRQATYDSVNELTGTLAQASEGKSPRTDNFTSNTSANWSKPGSGDTFDVDSTNAGKLTVTGVSQDNLSTGPGTTLLEPKAAAVLNWGPPMGPGSVSGSVTFPSSPIGVQGSTFGYQNGTYCQYSYIASTTGFALYRTNDSNTFLASGPTGASAHTLSTFTTRRQFGSASGAYPFGTGGASGTPSGSVGLFANIPGTAFGPVSVWDDADSRDLAGRWTNWTENRSSGVIPSASGRLQGLGGSGLRPALLRNLRLGRFQATFSLKGPTNVDLCFNATDQDDYDFVRVQGTSVFPPVYRPAIYSMTDGVGPTSPPSQTTSAGPTVGGTDTLWVRVTNDGTTVTVQEQVNDAGAPSASSWSSVTPCETCTGCRQTGGMLGFKNLSLGASVGNVTISSYDAATSAFDITEAVESFAVGSAYGSTYGFASDTQASDGNGNQTYDGTQAYTYDAWNRLMTVSHAYRDSSGTLQHGHAFDTMAYDARGRRIIKAVDGTGAWDCTYHYYLDQNSVVEEQNGSAQPIKQYVWGKQYIDELLQTSLNSNPTGQTTCDTPYWGCQDANWNVLGIVNSSGTLTERYEYTPYGQRQVLFSPGSNDPLCYAPTVTSRRFVASGSVAEPWGTCEVGHQGLPIIEDCNLIYDRARDLSPVTGRYLQRDPQQQIGMAGGISAGPSEQIERQGLLSMQDDLNNRTLYELVGRVKRAMRLTAAGNAIGKWQAPHRLRELYAFAALNYGTEPNDHLSESTGRSMYVEEEDSPETLLDPTGMKGVPNQPSKHSPRPPCNTAPADPQDGICTVPSPLGDLMNSCPLILRCCQNHDDCYRHNNCHSDSWLPWCGSLQCKLCNLGAMACVGSGGLLGQLVPQPAPFP